MDGVSADLPRDPPGSGCTDWETCKVDLLKFVEIAVQAQAENRWPIDPHAFTGPLLLALASFKNSPQDFLKATPLPDNLVNWLDVGKAIAHLQNQGDVARLLESDLLREREDRVPGDETASGIRHWLRGALHQVKSTAKAHTVGVGRTALMLAPTAVVAATFGGAGLIGAASALAWQAGAMHFGSWAVQNAASAARHTVDRGDKFLAGPTPGTRSGLAKGVKVGLDVGIMAGAAVGNVIAAQSLMNWANPPVRHEFSPDAIKDLFKDSGRKELDAWFSIADKDKSQGLSLDELINAVNPK